MAHTKHRRPRSNTQPKGRPTPPRTAAAPARRDTVTLQWTAVSLAIVGIVAGLIYFGGDWGGQPTHVGGGDGAPAVIDGAPFAEPSDRTG